MPVVNPLARELVFKVVYYGPGLGGKTTSLQHVHATTRPEHRGKMVSLATPVDRTLYFDFLPIRVPTSRDMTVRLQLFTVPGQVYYNATRKLVLTGADGVVFVVDSQRARADANIESLRNLEENLVEHGRALDEIPHVFSYNKRDLPGLVPIDDMERLLNARGAPSFATVATSGEGVYETLEAITRAVLEDFHQRMPEHRGLTASPMMLPEGGLAEALRMAEDPPAAIRQVESAKPRVGLDPSMAQDLSFSLPPVDDVGERAARVLAESGVRAGGDVQEIDTPIELLRTKRQMPSSTEAQRATPEASSEPPSGVVAEQVASPVEFMSEVVATLASGRPRHTSDPKVGADFAELEARIDTRRLLTDSAPAEASPVGLARPEPDSRAAPPQMRAAEASPSHSGFSLSSLWSDEERNTVVRVEDAITAGELRDAVLLLDVLVQRCLETYADGLGQAPPEPALLLLLIGMPGESILAFRRLCERARVTSTSVTDDEAKTALLFATQCRLLTRHTRA